jgi:hypothetical protein
MTLLAQLKSSLENEGGLSALSLSSVDQKMICPQIHSCGIDYLLFLEHGAPRADREDP